MGNSVGGRKMAKVMKIDGEMFKLKTPKHVRDIVKNYPGHVLLDSEAVKRFSIRAKPLEPDEELKPRRVCFLVELLTFPVGAEENNRAPRRVRSAGIQMSAKERLECLMLSRRTSSDLSLVRIRGEDGVWHQHVSSFSEACEVRSCGRRWRNPAVHIDEGPPNLQEQLIHRNINH